MATKAHCAYCFETLAANFARRQALSLSQVEDLWEQYHASKQESGDDVSGDVSDNDEDEEDAEMTDVDTDEASARPAAISRLLNKDSAASRSSSSLPSSTKSVKTSSSMGSGQSASGTATPASSMSSKTSLSSFARARRDSREGEYPLFVTWNTISRSGYKSLRGCIGTFEPQELEYGLRSYALTSAFEDVRFQPIPASLLVSLSAHVTLLHNFSTPTKDPLDWTLGKHGIRISFSNHGRRYGSTYLPDVAREQGWSKEETLISLMRKAGWNGSSSSWQKTWRDGKGELVRYEGKQVGLCYDEWKQWKDWVDGQGIQSKALN